MFAGSITRSGNSLIQDTSLIRKVYFPRLVMPISGVLSPLVDFGIAFIIFIGMMFFYGYSFNRAEEANVELARNALHESNEAALKMGGIPWKAEAPAQKQIINQMDPNTFELMNRVRSVLDPKGIMNPGNWEVV